MMMMMMMMMTMSTKSTCTHCRDRVPHTFTMFFLSSTRVDLSFLTSNCSFVWAVEGLHKAGGTIVAAAGLADPLEV